jgi:pyruvate kinase
MALRTLEPLELLTQLDTLVADVRRKASRLRADWPPVEGDFEPSARNLAAYLALRQHDLRPFQHSLMALGLSSLGRLESRVIEGLDAVRASLAAICDAPVAARPAPEQFFAGTERLRARADELFQLSKSGRPVAILVTCPSEAADEPAFFERLARRRVEAIRINCAHDDATAWLRMIAHARAAGAGADWQFRVFMDLAGPKIRTGKVAVDTGARLQRGDRLAIAYPGRLREARQAAGAAVAECTLDPAVAAARVADRVFYDDGKLGLVVEGKTVWGLIARVESCPDKGVRLKEEKALNFPDTDFAFGALTAKDLADLDVVARHADAVEYSFVQSPEDVVRLQEALAQRRPDWRRLGLVLKIETGHAIARLPDIIVQAAARQPTAVMIARGDLAVEIGFGRMAEMQEEILWLAEAAQVPVIWATQVLEHLVSKGTPLRGEMTDAAMAARAECVMLNKGAFLCEAIEALDRLLSRMSVHQHKKTPELRALRSWSGELDGGERRAAAPRDLVRSEGG